MMSKMMSGMKPEDMKNMAKMAQHMGGGMPGMGGGMGAPSSSAQSETASSSAVAAGGAANPMADLAGMDMANMDMSKGLDMMGSMTPDMMQAGMDMLKHARRLTTTGP